MQILVFGGTTMSTQHEPNRRAGSRTRSGELRAGFGVRNSVALGSQKVQPSGSHRPERAIDFAELGDGTLAEVVEDPMNPSRTRFAIFNQGRKYVSPTNWSTAAKFSLPIP